MQKTKKTITTKVLVRAAILTALSVILTRFFSIMITENLRVGIGTLPIMLSGLMFGPLVGAITGFVADIVGVLINPMGSFHPGFTLSSVLQGLLPGLVSFFLMKDKTKINWLEILLSIVLVFVGVHLVLNTVWVAQLYGNAFWVVLPGRVLKVTIEAIVTAILIKVIYSTIIPKI